MALSFAPPEDAPIDPALAKWATPAQLHALQLVAQNGGSPKAAEKALGLANDVLGHPIRRLRKIAAAKGFSPPHGLTHPVPDPFFVSKVSTLRNRDGEITAQWVQAKPDAEQRADLLRTFVEELCQASRGRAPLTARPAHLLSKILVSYKFGDPHFGLASGPEAGGDEFDTDEADRITRAGIDRLVSVAPAAETCIIEVIGDVMHANDSSALTPGHKNPLDVDKRGFHHALLMAARAWRYVIERALEKHGTVIVWMLSGNHDPDAAFSLSMALAFYFENEPRVKIDLGPAVFRYHRFGKNLLGAHHGDRVKMADLPLLMAVDRPEDWGATTYRYISTGHIHHDVVKEIQGVRVESLRTLAAKDPWHAFKGYRSLRDTRAVAYHADFGEIERYTVSAAMLEDRLAA